MSVSSPRSWFSGKHGSDQKTKRKKGNTGVLKTLYDKRNDIQEKDAFKLSRKFRVKFDIIKEQ